MHVKQFRVWQRVAGLGRTGRNTRRAEAGLLGVERRAGGAGNPARQILMELGNAISDGGMSGIFRSHNRPFEVAGLGHNAFARAGNHNFRRFPGINWSVNSKSPPACALVHSHAAEVLDDRVHRRLQW